MYLYLLNTISQGFSTFSFIVCDLQLYLFPFLNGNSFTCLHTAYWKFQFGICSAVWLPTVKYTNFDIVAENVFTVYKQNKIKSLRSSRNWLFTTSNSIFSRNKYKNGEPKIHNSSKYVTRLWYLTNWFLALTPFEC